MTRLHQSQRGRWWKFRNPAGPPSRHGGDALREATRAQATLTELAFIDDGITDGPGLLSLQAAQLPGDAVPSRPLFYALLPEPMPPTPLLAADAP